MCNRLPSFPMPLASRSPVLLGRCSHETCKRRTCANTVYSRAQCVLFSKITLPRNRLLLFVKHATWRGNTKRDKNTPTGIRTSEHMTFMRQKTFWKKISSASKTTADFWKQIYKTLLARSTIFLGGGGSSESTFPCIQVVYYNFY